MKKAWILSLLLVVILPQLLFEVLTADGLQGEPIPIVGDLKLETDVLSLLRILDGDEIIEMPLDDYVACVVMGEMPVSFEEEALKAQAVAVRTYTLRSILRGNKHTEAHICTESSCCQAFVNFKEDSVNKEGIEKVRNAVKDIGKIPATEQRRSSGNAGKRNAKKRNTVSRPFSFASHSSAVSLLPATQFMYGRPISLPSANASIAPSIIPM